MKKKSNVYIIDVGLSFAEFNDPVRVMNDLAEELIVHNVVCESSGCGFGFRDMQFAFSSPKVAKAALQLTITFLKRLGIDVENDDVESYASLYRGRR